MSRDRLKEKLAQLTAARAAPMPELLFALQNALSERNTYLVARAAALAAERYATDLLPELLATYERLFAPAPAVDPLAAGKTAIAKALKELDWRDPAAFLRGLHHVQLEAAYGPKVDVAVELRGTCALALVRCEIDDAVLLTELIERLGADPEKRVRIDATRAIADVGGESSLLVLRLKVLCGDAEAEVLGECFGALMQRAPRASLAFVVRFLSDKPDIAFEAACALASSREPAAQAAVVAFWPRSMPLEMRRAIIYSCAASAAPEAADFLLTIVRDPRSQLALWALAALGTSRFAGDIADRARAAAAATEDPAINAAYAASFAN